MVVVKLASHVVKVDPMARNFSAKNYLVAQKNAQRKASG